MTNFVGCVLYAGVRSSFLIWSTRRPAEVRNVVIAVHELNMFRRGYYVQ